MLNNLTLVLPTYERHQYVRRLLHYFSDCGVQVIIADGSSSRLFCADEGVFGALRWRYLHISGANTLLQRLAGALEMVDTEYFCFLDDCDFLLVSGLKKAVSQLTFNKNLNVAGGRVAEYFARLKSSEGFELVAVRDWGHWSAPYSVGSSGRPEERLRELISDVRTASWFYTVIRADALQQALTGAFRLKISEADAGELIICGILALSSSFAVGEYPHWMRGTVPPVPKKLFGDAISRDEWTFPKYEGEIWTAAEYMSKAVSPFVSEPVSAALFVDYFEHHRMSKGKSQQASSQAYGSPVSYWRTMLKRDLSAEELNDLARFESVVRIFPEGSVALGL